MAETTIDPGAHDAVVFDLDGVITDTASVHLAAWRRLFDDFLQERGERPGEDRAPFTDEDYRRDVDGKPRLDGIRSFLASRGIEVDEQTIADLAERKNDAYLERLAVEGVQIYDTSVALVRRLQLQGIGTAIFSASRNAGPVLDQAGLGDLVDVLVDGVRAAELDLPGKPDPAVPIEAARRLGAEPARTVIVEDAQAGVVAGRRGGFGTVIGVARTEEAADLREHGADVVVEDLGEVAVSAAERPLSEVPGALERWDAVTSLLQDRRLAVFLDFDGTLAPIVDDPGEATAPPATRDALERLARSCTVAIISGRDLADVSERIEIEGSWFAGSHGFELAGPDGERHEPELAKDVVPALDRAERRLRDELGSAEGVVVERKRFAIAVHTRRTGDDTRERAVAAVERCGDDMQLRVTGGREVAELRPDVDWDKGAAVLWLLKRLEDETGGPPTLPIYAGDDLTDEDALRTVHDDGLGIVVSNEEHGDRTTFAHVAVGGPGELGELLDRLAYLLETGR